MHQRDTYNQLVFGKELFKKVTESKVLLVGAGGIGCELLKNLVMSGFKTIQVIDLDTIDISNLNRQFLFQKQHVKKSKAHVAKESALKFNDSVNIQSFQANIKDSQFDIQWYKQFTVVLNALDNLEARRHVNAMCLAADIPLIESGTQGYLGQAYVIKKDQVECFDCQPKPTPTTYPVCTIRSTPSAPIHCIVWAKNYLFGQLFGDSGDEDLLQSEITEENAKELEALAREAEELKDIKASAGSPDYAKKVFDKVFNTDICRLLSMESMWKTRAKPTPLTFDDLEKTLCEKQNVTETEIQGLPDQKVWDLTENFLAFKQSAVKLSDRSLQLKKQNSTAVLSFDKDDEDAIEFVTATSNLRAHLFNITTKSLFDVKSMAGNIIPAIATTNAVIAGVAIMKALGVLRGDIQNNKRIYLTNESRLVQEANSEPNPDCGVCNSRVLHVKVNFKKTTLNHILQKIALASTEKGGAGMSEEDVVIMEGNRMIYDLDFDDNLDSTLEDIKLDSGSILRISQGDHNDLDLILETSHPQEDLVCLTNPIPAPKHIKKRRPSLKEDLGVAKKPKITHNETQDEIVLLEDDNDLVLLD
ncbi:hypothetical protein BY458DRAFT_525497 [Sporodiniella umbellata]|nr:hypothetical protein BY458DRAFT_525497 [Sporodiniella umbellata]